MNPYFTTRSACLALVLIALLAGVLAGGLVAKTGVLREQAAVKSAAPAMLPEVVVKAPRIED